MFLPTVTFPKAWNLIFSCIFSNLATATITSVFSFTISSNKQFSVSSLYRSHPPFFAKFHIVIFFSFIFCLGRSLSSNVTVKWSECVTLSFPFLLTIFATAFLLLLSIESLLTYFFNLLLTTNRSRQESPPDAGSSLVKGPPSTISFPMPFTSIQSPCLSISLKSLPPCVISL